MSMTPLSTTSTGATLASGNSGATSATIVATGAGTDSLTGATNTGTGTLAGAGTEAGTGTGAATAIFSTSPPSNRLRLLSASNGENTGFVLTGAGALATRF